MELPERLSARFEGSFAYKTVKDRLPTILVSVIDTLHKEKEKLAEKYPVQGTTQLKEVVSRLSKLRYEMMTNKPLNYLDDELPDASIWNDYLCQLSKSGDTPSWFRSHWLYVECLMYRQIVSSLKQSQVLADFDPFFESKKKSYLTSLDAIHTVIGYLTSKTSSPPTDVLDRKMLLREFLELSLWGNRCDLSISAGRDNSQTANPLKQVGQLDELILADDFNNLWDYLRSLRAKTKTGAKVRIDIILDNAGFELLSDLCLAEILLTLGCATEIVFHMKAYPWFVSDTTEEDVQFCVSQLLQSELLAEKTLGSCWANRINEGVFVFKKDLFWTLPHDFAAMRSVRPKLYSSLARSNLLIFKGDLNYRKLVGDRQWPRQATSFCESLLQFNPAPLLSLRTLKCDVCVGLSAATVAKLDKENKDWMTNGQYAVIQYTQTVLPLELPDHTVTGVKGSVVINPLATAVID